MGSAYLALLLIGCAKNQHTLNSPEFEVLNESLQSSLAVVIQLPSMAKVKKNQLLRTVMIQKRFPPMGVVEQNQLPNSNSKTLVYVFAGGWMIKMSGCHCQILDSVIIHPQIEARCIARVAFGVLPFPSFGEAGKSITNINFR